MFEVPIEFYKKFVGEIVYFKYRGWSSPVKSLLVSKGEYRSCDGGRINVVEEDGLCAIYLEESEDGGYWCSRIDELKAYESPYCTLFACCVNKGEEHNHKHVGGINYISRD